MLLSVSLAVAVVGYRAELAWSCQQLALAFLLAANHSLLCHSITSHTAVMSIGAV